MGRDFWLENVTRKEKKSSKGPLIYYVIGEWALLERGYQNKRSLENILVKVSSV